jgi:AmmeMemoRadiSam system protein B
MRAWMLDFPGVIASDAPHAMEHSIEVQLPFLQSLLGEFELTPILVGDVPPETVETLIDRVLRTPETLLVVSSDLSHYHPYREAQALDRSTTAAIVNRRYEDIGPEQACGCRALNGLLRFAITQQLNVAALSYCNSGDTAGPRDRVVGYGAYAVG